ncbi:intermembrane transport protein PqiB [Syntrophotalea acetylenivorans]|uniref:PqiB family protein n=1 Tax=Syntrophotalea acetylenivorans TaxID=1842532 RepID=UPI000AF3AEF2|nr:MlaD family protein [Syntrophotalea acetylenivorans]
MNDSNINHLPPEAFSQAEVRTKQGFSIVWLIPLIALAIGGWLAFKAITEHGPLISIHFTTAEGLEAGKTKIKYKDVVIGEVEEIKLSEKLDGVIVLARMDKDTKPYLTEETRFWVVRARISAGEVSGLGTLLSGAYIGMDPIQEGKPTRSFTGLAKQPLVTADEPGQHYLLRSPSLGSLNIASPVFYRQIKVGEVVDYDFDQTGQAVEIKVFIHAPHDKRINSATKFWNASGVDVKMDARGIKVDTQSIVSIFQGGIAFDTPSTLDAITKVSDSFKFPLHPDREAATKKSYAIKNYYMMYFDQSVRGLVPGAPVEFGGIQIGEVVDFKLIIDTASLKVRIPVLVMIEPERLELYSNGKKVDYQSAIEERAKGNKRLIQEELLKHGMRAQLKTGNLLTGQLYIEIGLFPDAEPVEVAYENDYPIFPTVSTPLGKIAEDISKVVKKIDSIPIEELGEDLHETIVTLRATLQEFRGRRETSIRRFYPT